MRVLCGGLSAQGLQVTAGKGLQGALAEWLGQFRVPGNVRLAVDIDPQSFL